MFIILKYNRVQFNPVTEASHLLCNFCGFITNGHGCPLPACQLDEIKHPHAVKWKQGHSVNRVQALWSTGGPFPPLCRLAGQANPNPPRFCSRQVGFGQLRPSPRGGLREHKGVMSNHIKGKHKIFEEIHLKISEVLEIWWRASPKRQPILTHCLPICQST